uniref:Immunoglobulin domain-containing protein n=1 Tax=Poecilia formosa TaxID=48698 RepID=A0A096MBK7_POEFO
MITARETQTSLFLTLMLYLTATAAGQDQFLTVRVGDEATLPCRNVICTRNQCDGITWMFSDKRSSTLFENGQITEAAAAKSDRLKVTSGCSLVMKNVSVEDVGLYTYRQFVNGQQESDDANIYLSVIHMVQQKQKDKLILTCSVTDFSRCRHTVEWLNEGGEKMLSDMEEPDQSCSDTVTIPASDRNWKVKSEVLKCKVTNSYINKQQLFDFRIQSSGGKTAKTTTTTKPPRKISTRKSTTTKTTTTKLPATLST